MTARDRPVLTVRSVPHPDPGVRQLGWRVTDPYLEHCWVSVIGPAAVLLLRRLAALTRDGAVIAIPVDELAASIGLGRGTGRHATINRVLDRIVAFRFATRHDANDLTLFEQVPQLGYHHLEVASCLTRQLHDTLSRSRANRIGQRADGGSA